MGGTGHRVLHAPFSPSKLPGAPESLRMSATHWSRVGESYRADCDRLRNSHGGFCGASESHEIERAVLQDTVRQTCTQALPLGVGMETRKRDRVAPVASSLAVASSGLDLENADMTMRLHLRGGVWSNKCHKPKS